MTFSREELLMMADVNNPGPLGAHVGHDCGWGHTQGPGLEASPGFVVQELLANVADSFELHPGQYEDKWGIERTPLMDKLAAAGQDDLSRVARAIARFWDHCQDPDAEAKLIELQVI